MHLAPRRLTPALLAFMALAGFACGSRTGLLGEGPWQEDIDDEDAAAEPLPTPRLDASERDAGFDLPGLDASPDVDVDQRDCKDPNETLVYLVSSSYELYSFDPRSGQSRVIAPIACPTTLPGRNGRAATPFSMAVDREGVAYVVFDSGELFRVSTATGACAATPYQANQHGIARFGMGFASDQGGPAETLFVASGSDNNNAGQELLGRVPLPEHQLEVIAALPAQVAGAELTGSGDGRLFAFYRRNFSSGDSFIGQVDKQTGQIVAESMLPLANYNAWAFAFWGGDFYTFTSSTGPATVTRYRPSTGAIDEIATIPTAIVGAGVSTCSPVN